MSTNLSYREQTQLYSYKRVTITGVDTGQGLVDCTDEGLTTYQIPINYYNNSYTAIPAVNEIWLIKKISNTWEFHQRAEQNNYTVDLSSLNPGDHRIDVPGDLHINTGGSVILSDTALTGAVNTSSIKFPLDFNPGNDTGLNQDVLIVQGSANDYPLLSLTEKVNEGYWTLSWSDGTNPPDVDIYRSGENTITITGNLIIEEGKQKYDLRQMWHDIQNLKATVKDLDRNKVHRNEIYIPK
jgi:hypothetical protein